MFFCCWTDLVKLFFQPTYLPCLLFKYSICGKYAFFLLFGLVCSWTGLQQSPRAFIVDDRVKTPENYCPSMHAYSFNCEKSLLNLNCDISYMCDFLPRPEELDKCLICKIIRLCSKLGNRRSDDCVITQKLVSHFLIEKPLKYDQPVNKNWHILGGHQW